MQNECTKIQEETALERFKLISPLLDEGLDNAKRVQLRKEISARSGKSVRSLYRYEEAYRENSFSGLKPNLRGSSFSSRLPLNYDKLLEDAIQLKKEVPKRSVTQIIFILEEEGKVAPGVLKPSTLARHLYRAGYGVRQIKMAIDARECSAKRFCKPHRMMLVQGDIKYGPVLKINGKKVKTYLSSAIDDHSRFLIHSAFYDNQGEEIVEDSFRQAIQQFGKMDACYFDNGSQYIAGQLELSLGKLGIRIVHAKPRSGKSKGYGKKSVM